MFDTNNMFYTYIEHNSSDGYVYVKSIVADESIPLFHCSEAQCCLLEGALNFNQVLDHIEQCWGVTDISDHIHFI